MKIMKHVPYSEKNRHFCFLPKKGIAPSRNNLKTHGFRMSLFQPYPSCVRLAKGYTLQGSVCISQSGVDCLVGQGPFFCWENRSGFSAGKKHERNSGKIFWESRWRKTLQLKFEL